MSEYHAALLIAAIISGGASYNVPRAWLWIGCLAASFIVSVAYLYNAPQGYTGGSLWAWWPPSSVIAGLCDVAVCLALRAWGVRLWESLLFTLMLFSVAVNIAYSASILLNWPPIPPQEAYAIILEAINYIALIIIGGTGILKSIGSIDAHSDFFRRIVHSIRVASDTFQKKAPPSQIIRLW